MTKPKLLQHCLVLFAILSSSTSTFAAGCGDVDVLNGMEMVKTGRASALSIKALTAYSVDSVYVEKAAKATAAVAAASAGPTSESAKAASASADAAASSASAADRGIRPGRVTSITVTTTTLLNNPETTNGDYARLQYLGYTGGALNIMLHRMNTIYCDNSVLAKQRASAGDRVYFGGTHDNPVDASSKFYWSNGIGYKGINPDTKESVKYKSTGLLYLGLGMDTLLFSDPSELKVNNQTGFISAEMRLTANIGNRATLNEIFSTTNAPKILPAIGGHVEAMLPGYFYLNLGYTKGVGSYGKSTLKEVSTIAVGIKKSIN